MSITLAGELTASERVWRGESSIGGLTDVDPSMTDWRRYYVRVRVSASEALEKFAASS